MINNIIPYSQEADCLEETNIQANIYNVTHTCFFFFKRAKSGCLQEKVEKIKTKRRYSQDYFPDYDPTCRNI